MHLELLDIGCQIFLYTRLGVPLSFALFAFTNFFEKYSVFLNPDLEGTQTEPSPLYLGLVF